MNFKVLMMAMLAISIINSTKIRNKSKLYLHRTTPTTTTVTTTTAKCSINEALNTLGPNRCLSSNNC